jgi:hypothetical protein
LREGVELAVAIYDVAVILYGYPEEGYPWSSALENPSTTPAYRERPSVVLRVDESESIGRIIDRAGSHFGVSSPEPGSGVQEYDTLSDLLGYTAFYRRGEDSGLPSYVSSLTLVGPDGEARFNVPWTEVRYGDLVRASQSGLVDGDVTNLYLFLPTAFGDFGGFDWPEVIAALGVVWQVIDHAATAFDFASGIHWSKGLLDRLRRRSEHRVEALVTYAPSWRERGAAPADLDRLLSLRAWKADEVSALLGCPLDQAEAILWALGASYNHADGRWYMERTPEDKMLHGDFLIAIWGHRGGEDRKELGESVTERVKKYLETGQAPKLPWES